MSLFPSSVYLMLLFGSFCLFPYQPLFQPYFVGIHIQTRFLFPPTACCKTSLAACCTGKWNETISSQTPCPCDTCLKAGEKTVSRVTWLVVSFSFFSFMQSFILHTFIYFLIHSFIPLHSFHHSILISPSLLNSFCVYYLVVLRLLFIHPSFSLHKAFF